MFYLKNIEPPEPKRARPYKPPPEPEKHYKIIFIKVVKYILEPANTFMTL